MSVSGSPINFGRVLRFGGFLRFQRDWRTVPPCWEPMRPVDDQLEALLKNPCNSQLSPADQVDLCIACLIELGYPNTVDRRDTEGREVPCV
jgi:hypothetical protein